MPSFGGQVCVENCHFHLISRFSLQNYTPDFCFALRFSAPPLAFFVALFYRLDLQHFQLICRLFRSFHSGQANVLSAIRTFALTHLSEDGTIPPEGLSLCLPILRCFFASEGHRTDALVLIAPRLVEAMPPAMSSSLLLHPLLDELGPSPSTVPSPFWPCACAFSDVFALCAQHRRRI